MCIYAKIYSSALKYVIYYIDIKTGTPYASFSNIKVISFSIDDTG
jgi:hypothetical protein